MALVALAFYVLYLATAFGEPTLVQLRSRGSTGFKGISGHLLSAEWIGGVLFGVAPLLGLAVPVLDSQARWSPSPRWMGGPDTRSASSSSWRASQAPSPRRSRWGVVACRGGRGREDRAR